MPFICWENDLQNNKFFNVLVENIGLYLINIINKDIIFNDFGLGH